MVPKMRATSRIATVMGWRRPGSVSELFMWNLGYQNGIIYAMNPEAIAYPFLSLAIFFEAFMLVTFLSDPARKARLRKTTVEGPLPRVALIIPCYNEEEGIDSTMRATPALDYPAGKLEVILVNDGSKDNTRAKMREYAGDSRVRIIDQANGGKQ